jgi:hypothetical protein
LYGNDLITRGVRISTGSTDVDVAAWPAHELESKAQERVEYIHKQVLEGQNHSAFTGNHAAVAGARVRSGKSYENV